METICKNCKHYRQHYIKTKYGLEKVASFHCSASVKRSKERIDCQDFEEKESLEEKKETVKSLLKNINYRLEKISYLFNDNEIV